MKRVTASEARKNWFRLLDEVAAGQVIVLERKGRRIVLRREARLEREPLESVPDYRALLKVPHADRAAAWGWEWTGPESKLVPRARR